MPSRLLSLTTWWIGSTSALVLCLAFAQYANAPTLGADGWCLLVAALFLTTSPLLVLNRKPSSKDDTLFIELVWTHAAVCVLQACVFAVQWAEFGTSQATVHAASIKDIHLYSSWKSASLFTVGTSLLVLSRWYTALATLPTE